MEILIACYLLGLFFSLLGLGEIALSWIVRRVLYGPAKRRRMAR